MKRIEQSSLFSEAAPAANRKRGNGATTERLQRVDAESEFREELLPFCRLSYGQIWEDKTHGHRAGVLDATKAADVLKIMGGQVVPLAIGDPPYNLAVGNANTRNLSKTDVSSYIEFSRAWGRNVIRALAPHAHLYVWMGADYKEGFQPLPDFMLMMRGFPEVRAKNFITVRNQRGYGTQKNWMWVRQELLHYTKGRPRFIVTYTEIPKILRGYYKRVNGKVTENLERSRSKNIRPGNVWVDIQQVFYRMEENVPGCYAQKPIKAIQRIMETSSVEGDLVLDCFSHSGTALIAGELLGRRVFTFDIDPIYAELTIRRLEHYRKTGKTGWQWRNPFPETENNSLAGQ